MYKNFIKRLLDVIGALILSPFILILIVILAPFYFFLDRGPLFYNAKRLGKNGIPFKMFKFRSMIVNAPDIRLEDGSTYNGEDDPRVTKLGHFLRKTSIDELPQIFNVLIGNMSFIGPRPDTLDSWERYTETDKTSLWVKPGITGYNQAYFRNSIDAKEKLKNDVYYAHHVSLKIDIMIFFKTIKSVLWQENINITSNHK